MTTNESEERKKLTMNYVKTMLIRRNPDSSIYIHVKVMKLNIMLGGVI